MEKQNIYSPPRAEMLEVGVPSPRKPSLILMALSAILILINAFFVFLLLDVNIESSSSAYYAGYIVGQLLGVVLLPVIVAGLFQMGKNFRNWASRIKIFFWTSIVILISKIGSLLSMVPPTDY